MATTKTTTKKTTAKLKDTTNEKPKRGPIEIPDFEEDVMGVTVYGDSLITHAWSEKAKKEMLDLFTSQKTTKQRKLDREPKDPEAEFQGARYLNDKGEDCIPAVAVKNAMVTAGMRYYGYSQPHLRGVITVLGDMLPIQRENMVMREDPVRVGPWSNRKADLRYRPGYINWAIDLEILFDTSVIKPKDLINLLRRAGVSVGLHEWRIEKGGAHGGFGVDMASIQTRPFKRPLPDFLKKRKVA